MNKIIMNKKEFLIQNESRYESFWKHVDAGTWENNTLDIIINNLSANDVYVDIGAWVGPTVLAAASTGSLVYAYEPDPIAYSELQDNIELNKIKNVILKNAALFDRNGYLSFGPGRGDSLGDSISSLMNGEGSVKVITCDVLDESKLSHFVNCKLLKMDVEGAEFIILPRMISYLTKTKPIFMLSIHGLKTAGYFGFFGFLKMVLNRYKVLRLISIYPYQYIENRRGWLDTNASWVTFNLYRKINFIVSARGNRELLLSSTPLDI